MNSDSQGILNRPLCHSCDKFRGALILTCPCYKQEYLAENMCKTLGERPAMIVVCKEYVPRGNKKNVAIKKLGKYDITPLDKLPKQIPLCNTCSNFLGVETTWGYVARWKCKIQSKTNAFLTCKDYFPKDWGAE